MGKKKLGKKNVEVNDNVPGRCYINQLLHN